MVKFKQTKTRPPQGNIKPTKRLDVVSQTYRTLGIRKAALPVERPPPAPPKRPTVVQTVQAIPERDDQADSVFFSTNDAIDDDDEEDDNEYSDEEY